MHEPSKPTKPNQDPAESPEASEDMLEEIEGAIDASGGDALLSGEVEASKKQKMPDEGIDATNFSKEKN